MGKCKWRLRPNSFFYNFLLNMYETKHGVIKIVFFKRSGVMGMNTLRVLVCIRARNIEPVFSSITLDSLGPPFSHDD